MDATAAIRRETITEAAAVLFSAADSVKQIPERFIRTDEIQADGAVIVGDDETFELPVVDMAKLLDPESSASETAKLGSACRDWGFFQVRIDFFCFSSHVIVKTSELRRYLSSSVAADEAWSGRGGGTAHAGQRCGVLQVATAKQERHSSSGGRHKAPRVRLPLQPWIR
jgi:hypothetical protein